MVMNRFVKVAHQALAVPFVYDSFQMAVGSLEYRESLVSSALNTSNAKTVIDLGCGTSSTIRLLNPLTQYIGVDISQSYLNKARKRSTLKTARFICSDISDYGWVKGIDISECSLAFALGIFHHLDDRQLNLALENLSNCLPSGGKVLTLDPVIDETTTQLARWFARNDRGQFLRTPNHYQGMFAKFGFSISFKAVRNTIRIPYDQLIISATKD